MRLFLIAALLISSAVASAGEVYKWVDKDGKVHYGDKPKTQPAEAVMAKPGNFPGEPLDPEVEKAAASRNAACASKRQQLASYEKATVIKQTDALGQTREFGEAERQKLLALTRAEAEKACSPADNTAAAETAAE